MRYIDRQKSELAKYDKDQLIAQIINRTLNNFVAEYADYEKDEEHPERDKRVPYIGWYWRDTDFVGRSIYIGNCGEFIGVMENNKWDYPERRLTEEEADKVVQIVEEAYELSRAGGILSDIIANTKSKLDELWDLFQTFKIQTTGYWIYGIQGMVGHSNTAEDADQMVALLSDAAPGLRYWKVEVE